MNESSPVPPFVVFSDVLDIYDDVEGFRAFEGFEGVEAFDGEGRRVFPSYDFADVPFWQLFRCIPRPAILLRVGEPALNRMRSRLVEYLEDDSMNDASLAALIAAARRAS